MISSWGIPASASVIRRLRKGESGPGTSRLLVGRPVTGEMRPVARTVPPSRCRRTPVWLTVTRAVRPSMWLSVASAAPAQ